MRMNAPSILLSLLVAGVSLTGVAAAQSTQPDVSALLKTRSSAMAERYSYVYLDPLEGNGKAAKSDDAQHQNFTLHGHWVIDVKNADGSVAEHRDFENAIASSGPYYLFSLMAGYAVPSDYAIVLQSTPGTPPCNVSSTSGACVIVRSLTTNPGYAVCGISACTTGLTVTYNLNPSTPSANSMVLAGSFSATKSGVVDLVSTVAGSCPVTPNQPTLGTVSPATCNSAAASAVSLYGLSQTTIPAFTVTSGQIVQVSVTITFS